MKLATRFAAGAAALALSTAPALAQDDEQGFAFSAEQRSMVETYDNGFRANAAANDTIALLRTRLAASWSNDTVEFNAVLNDARVYGDDAATPVTANEVNALELVELSVGIRLSDQVRVIAGRQMFDLGSKRLFANPGYRNAPNAYTGVRLEWDGGDAGEITAFYVLPHERLPSDKPSINANDVRWDRESFDLAAWGAIYSRSLPGGFGGNVYLFGLDERDSQLRANRNRHLITPGINLFRRPAPGQVDGEIEIAGQFGSIRTSTAAAAPEVDVRAWTAHAEIGFSPDLAWRPRISAIADIATGDDASTPEFERFDPLYGPRRGDWNPTGTHGPFGRSNIRSLGVKAEARPSSRMDLFATYRQVWLDSATDAFSFTRLTSASGAAGRDGGSQIDARARWWAIPRQLQLEFGGALLMKGPFFEAFPTVPQGDTRFLYMAVHTSF